MIRTVSARIGAVIMIAMPVSVAQGQSDVERQLMLENFQQADANGDGALNAGEFETLINLNAADNLGQAARLANSGNYQRAFNRIDQNRDGIVTQAELQAMAR